MKTLILYLLITTGISLTEAGEPDKLLTDSETGELLTDWMDIQLSAIRNTKSPSHNFRQNCYISIAFYESIVHSDKNYRSLANQVNGLESLPPPPADNEICWHASANAAMAEMLRFNYPDNPLTVHKIDSMENVCNKNFREKGFSDLEIESGVKYGKSIAKAIIEWCRMDGSDKENLAYNIPKGDGMWEPTPPKFSNAVRPWAKNSRTIVKGSVENTLQPPPCTFSKNTTSEFYQMVMEVYKESESHNDVHQSIALHWDDAPDGTSIGAGGHWLHILRNELINRKTPLPEGAKIWAAMSIAMFDASIGCFIAKYTYNVMRPVTYIRANMNRPDWNPLITTPSHPEYPAAHATISMAAATVLAQLLGNNIEFNDDTYEYKGLKARNFKCFTDAGKEAGMSRLYGGIHYRPSIEAGYIVGEKIANNVLETLVFNR